MRGDGAPTLRAADNLDDPAAVNGPQRAGRRIAAVIGELVLESGGRIMLDVGAAVDSGKRLFPRRAAQPNERQQGKNQTEAEQHDPDNPPQPADVEPKAGKGQADEKPDHEGRRDYGAPELFPKEGGAGETNQFFEPPQRGFAAAGRVLVISQSVLASVLTEPTVAGAGPGVECKDLIRTPRLASIIPARTAFCRGQSIGHRCREGG